MIPPPREDLLLSQIRFVWSVGGAAGGAVFSAPDGSRAFRVDLENGMPTRRTKGLKRINIAWKTKANRLSRKTIFLPAGARDVEAHYVYQGPPAQDAREGPPPEDEAVEEVAAAEGVAVEEVAAAKDVAGDPEIARLYGIHPPQGQRFTDTGVPLVDIGSFLRDGMKCIGEGAYSFVYAISRPGLPPVCVKKFKRPFRRYHYEEAETLHALRKVPGLPRLVGLSPSPAAVVMTYHGPLEFHKWICKHFDLDEYLEILLALSTILHGLHTAGFTHNDLKGDNVVVDRRNVPTLIDVGLVSFINSRPYRYNATKKTRHLENVRAR
ncbi:uncharacterized protein [Penaeus vannamei]|uniref:uncharacterized protein n=1 Tax=Penaeus vannamei TaxID=6689 RepID=UPI00387FA4B5